MMLSITTIKTLLPSQVRAMTDKEYKELRNFVIKLIKDEDSRRV
jgi:hypothetical protein